MNEKAIVTKIEGNKAPAVELGSAIVQVDSRYFRPAEVETLLGDPKKARIDLGWMPQISLRELVKEMINTDFREAVNQTTLNSMRESTISKMR